MKRVFIFDFDGTFYSGEHKFDNVKGKVDLNKRKFLPNVSDEEYENICMKHSKWLDAFTGNDIVRCIYLFKRKYGLDVSVEAFKEWQNTDLYDIIIDYNQIIDVDFIRDLANKYSVYVVSNSSINHLKYYMDKIGVNKDWFKRVYSNEFIESDPSKEHYYKEILNEEKCDSKDVYVFGDSVGADLSPALHLGMNAFCINNAKSIKSLVNRVLEYDI